MEGGNTNSTGLLLRCFRGFELDDVLIRTILKRVRHVNIRRMEHTCIFHVYM
jgi:hypothetical protein